MFVTHQSCPSSLNLTVIYHGTFHVIVSLSTYLVIQLQNGAIFHCGTVIIYGQHLMDHHWIQLGFHWYL